jgi:hypothetical protein
MLKRACPGKKISVRRKKIRDDQYLGYAIDCGGYYEIVVSNDIDMDFSLHVLLHEFGHVMQLEEKNHHGPNWGRAYAKLYREVYLQQYLGEKNNEE